MKRGNRY
ncbi:rCG22438 [Rattus norvegicus]|nr:rCG22438 [Rattus norvegicus]